MQADIYVTNQPIKVVSFDLWGTLVRPNPVFNHKRTEFLYSALDCKARGVAYDYFAQTLQKVKGRTERQSELTGLHISFAARIQALCDELGLVTPDETTLKKWQHHHSKLLRTYPAILIHPDIPALFTQIAASGRQIAIVSNSGLVTADDSRYLLDIYALKVYIRYLVFSDELGLAKPNSRLFAKIVDITDCDPATILHIGDSKAADFEGAKRAGFGAVLATMAPEGIVKIQRLLALITRPHDY
jgi:putative hydrolase of the HAD superfamily